MGISEDGWVLLVRVLLVRVLVVLCLSFRVFIVCFSVFWGSFGFLAGFLGR